MQRSVITVLGSGSDADVKEEKKAKNVKAVGRLVAETGCHLLTGGGMGVMAAVSEAFVGVTDRAGLCIGVLPASETDPAKPRSGYPNDFVELVIRTHLPLSGVRGAEPLSRNHINVLSADAIIALPGGAGTRSEIDLALTYKKPIAAYGWPAGEALKGVPVLADPDGLRVFLKKHIRANS